MSNKLLLGLVISGLGVYLYLRHKAQATKTISIMSFPSQYRPIVSSLISGGWAIDEEGNALNPSTGERYNIYKA